MKNWLVSALIASSVFGCASISPKPIGVFYTNVTDAGSVSSNAAGSRVGEACAQSVLGLVAWGDAGVELARRNGGITHVSWVDETRVSYLGLYSKNCTVVRGK